MKSPSLFLTVCLLASCLITEAIATDGKVTILSQNMNRLYDDVDDGKGKIEDRERYRKRLQFISAKLIKHFNSPDIIAFQEIEKLRVLEDLADRLRVSGGPDYRAILQEGNDVSGIDVGYLVKSHLRIRQSKQLFKPDRLALDHSPLYSRPPLMVEVCKRTCLTLVNIHLRSMRGLRSLRKGRRVAIKRRAQAEKLAGWIEHYQTHKPENPVLIVGDFNALQPADGFSDIVGIIKGRPDNTDAHYPGKDLISEDLVDLSRRIPGPQRYSFVYKGQTQQLDYLLTSKHFAVQLNGIRFGEVDRKFSDHRGLLAEFNW